MSVTRFGVSVENVVATIENPRSHHGILRFDKKYSEVFLPDFFETIIPMVKTRVKKEIIKTQSIVANFIKNMD